MLKYHIIFSILNAGKTLIARQIGKVLNAREPKIVNGPEILNKYVGGSEEKVRELFAEVRLFPSLKLLIVFIMTLTFSSAYRSWQCLM